MKTVAAAVVSVLLGTGGHTADHGDGPLVSGTNRTADIGDGFLFLDPNDNDFLIAAVTVQGFIVPSEAVNFSVFDPSLKYQFEFETTGDAAPDFRATVTFSPKTAPNLPQTARVRPIPNIVFNAPTTVSTLGDASPAPVVTTHAPTGISFFAGEVDDPFPFDIVGFGRFVASVLAGAPSPAQLQRGRDSFAGYNTLAIALRIPVAALGNVADGVLGLAVRTLDSATDTQLDRMGNPGINVALVPFPRKDEYNRSRPQQDAAGLFANSIVGTLTALGTNATNIGVLANIAVTRGDFLRVNLDTPNTGTGGGNNAAAAFPNGRRLGDDTIDTIIAVVTNGGITTGDNAVKEKPLRNVFPFFAATHQPFAKGTVDDLTRN